MGNEPRIIEEPQSTGDHHHDGRYDPRFDDKLNVDQPRAFSNFVLESTASATVILDSTNPATGASQLRFRKEGVTEADLFSASNRFLLRRINNVGGNTSVELFDDYIHLTKRVRGEETQIGDADDTLTTKGYVDSVSTSTSTSSQSYTISGGASFGGYLQLEEATANGAHWLRLAPSDAMSEDMTIKFPSARPSVGQRLEVVSVTGDEVVMGWVS